MFYHRVKKIKSNVNGDAARPTPRFNSPELFAALIGVVNHSAVGAGTVIGPPQTTSFGNSAFSKSWSREISRAESSTVFDRAFPHSSGIWQLTMNPLAQYST